MSYPNITDKDFNKLITKKLDKYKIPKKKKNFDEICYPKEFELQNPQITLSKYINPNTPYMGLLVYHKIGSGKTCTAINIGEQWKHTHKIMVIVPASLISNFKGELRSKCAGNEYMTSKERKQIKSLHPSSKEYKDIINKTDERINKHYIIYSYHKFISLIENEEFNLNKTILIIDEVQNMVSENGKFYKLLYDTIHNAPKNLRIVLLSATPMFDKPIEIALTMNLLRLPQNIPINKEFEKTFIKILQNKKTGEYIYKAQNMDIFKQYIKGYVSYYQGSPEYVFPHGIIKYVNCDMSLFQYQSYITTLKREEKKLNLTHKDIIKKFTIGEIKNLPTHFFLGARLISNIAFPNKNIGLNGFNSLNKENLQLENLKEYSIKFYNIITRINKSQGPVYVYSNFKEFGGLKSLATALEHNGYSDYIISGEGKNRYAIISGDESKHMKDEIKNVYNQIQNYNGSKLKVLLLSPTAKEGLSLFSVKQIHILEPYWNSSRIEQVIGRGIRTCSHKFLPEDKRITNIYIYIATHENELETIDQYISNLAIKKSKLIGEFELALKQVAFDCHINKNANDENLICDI